MMVPEGTAWPGCSATARPGTPMKKNLRTGSARLARLALFAGAVCALLFARTADGADRRFALVVGYNHSDDPDLEALSYADDDALRTAELLGAHAERVIVLADLDEDSRALWGAVDGLRAPTPANVTAALESLRGSMAAVPPGDRAVLWFVYSGHGNYDPAGRGYVHLDGGHFTTRDLYQQVIRPAGDDPVVLMVDACNASLLVRSRGGVARRPAGDSRLRFEDYPNVGVILASSTVGETHEWGRYLAGIFSHEVRSALLGAGDVDDDGAVNFAELAAFVAAANARVTNPTVRITPYIRPPLGDPAMTLLSPAEATASVRVRIGPELAGKAHVIDDRLVRVADFHKAPGVAFSLALPADRAHTLVLGDDEIALPRTPGATVDAARLARAPRSLVAARGAGSAYFERTLFQQPFGATFARGYLEDRYLDDLEVHRWVARPWYENAGAWAVTGAGLASLGAAVGLHVAAHDAADRAAAAQWADDRDRHNRRTDTLRTWGHVTTGVGAAALLGGSLWLALDRPMRKELHRPSLAVSFGPSGITLVGRH